MMKNVIRVFTLTLLMISLFAEGSFLKTKSYQIGPGTYYSEYTHPEPWVLYVVETDLTNPYITLESVKANDRLYSFEGPNSMSKRNNRAGHYVLSAINGDFYDTGNGAPISTHIVNGEFVKKTSNSRSAFSYTEDKKLHIGSVLYSGMILAKDSTDQWDSYTLANTNISRAENTIIAYNHFWGSSTGTNSFGYECLATPLDPWRVNDTVRCVIETCESGIGNMTIPNGKVVISGHGTAIPFLSTNCQQGDTVMIVQNVANHLPSLTMLVGGGPRMLSNGADVVASSYPSEGIGAAFCSDRHPRTAIGFNQDSTKVYFVVVDGRQQGFSSGMSLYEMANFMQQIGIAHAVNLDGGGSSSMTVRNSIMNSPSDGGERSVANGIICVSSAPVGDLAHIQFIQDSLAVYKNHSVNTNLTGWDTNYNPVSLGSWTSLNISYDTDLGLFNENVFTANEADGNTYLTADYNGEKDSVLIHIVELYDLSIYPETVTIDSVNGIEFQVTATNEAGGRRVYDNDLFEFTIMDSSFVSIDGSGNIIGKHTGTTKVIVRYGTQLDTADVSVEIGEGEVVADEIESLEGWTLSGDSHIDMSATTMNLVDRGSTGAKAIRVDYTHLGTEDGIISIACDPLNIYGVPSYILVDVLADSQKNWIYIDLQDARGVDYSVKCSSSLRYNDGYHTQYLDMANLLPSDGEQLYPLKITGVRLRIDDKASSGSMYIDRIRLTYPGWTSIDEDPSTMIPTEYCLHQNYPNPFNPITNISYEIAEAAQVNLSVYDITGNKVATLIQGYQNAGSYHVEFMADKLSTGVYLYRLQAGNWVDTKKMLIIK